MSLKIYLLGQFKLKAGDRPIELPSRPAQSLLAYLALNAGVTHRREKLASLLWLDSTDANARSYLRQALWRIRKHLEEASLDWEDFLQINDISVTFDAQADYWLDAQMFLERVQGRPVTEIIEIVQLYQGELLPGFYDEWILPERDRLQSAYHQQMTLLLESLIQDSRWDDAIKWGEQWIRLSHSPEPAFRALMSAYAGSGDQGMVEVTYQRCMESLERELDVDPSPKTESLYRQIITGDWPGYVKTSAPVAETAAPKPFLIDKIGLTQVEKPMFVARERELAQLDAFLQRSISSEGRVVFITGESGSGKTALIQELAHRAQDAHADLIVASGNCNAHTGVGDPYLPFREILELLTGDVEARWAVGAITAEQASLLWDSLPLAAQALVEVGPDLITTFIPGTPLLERAVACAGDNEPWLAQLKELTAIKVPNSMVLGLQQSDLFEQYAKVLKTLARRSALLIVVDDLQWADRGSLSLLFHLGRTICNDRILILCAYRPEEVAMGWDGERHPLLSLVNEFQRLFGQNAIDLDQAESHDFLEAILDSEPNKLGNSFRKMLYRQTRGQPLFIIELLHGMQDRGDLVLDQEGSWVEGPALDWETLPARVEAVIAERIGRLAEPERTALQVASVEGEQFTAEVVARVVGTNEREMLGCLSGDLDKKHRLVGAQSITRLDGRLRSRYRFRHILFQKYLYSSLDEVERVYLHEQVGTALEEMYGSHEEVRDLSVNLARHFQEAKITSKAIHYLHQAGDKAVQLSAYQEGIVHLTKGLNLLMTLPDSPERSQQELDLQLSLGMAWMRDIPGPERTQAYNRARELSQMMGKTSQLRRVLGEISISHYVRAEHRKALELADEVLNLAQLEEDPMALVLGHWHLGFLHFALGKFAKAHDHLGQVISFYDPQQHHELFVLLRGSDSGASALAYDACCLWALGYPEKALNLSQKALSLARELNHPFTSADVVCYAGCIFSKMRHDAVALLENAEELMRLATEKSIVGWLAAGTWYRGEAFTKMGKVHQGIALMGKGLEISRLRNIRINLSGTLGSLAIAQSMIGRLEEGLDTLTEAFAFVEETGERYWEVELYCQRAEILGMQGDEIEAETSLKKACEVARQQQAKYWELRAVTDLAKLWCQQGKQMEAQAILAETYHWFTEGFDTPDLIEARALLEDIGK